MTETAYTTMYVRMLWLPYGGNNRFRRRLVWPPPRLKQLAIRLNCEMTGHQLTWWTVDDEDGFSRRPPHEGDKQAIRRCLNGCGRLDITSEPWHGTPNRAVRNP